MENFNVSILVRSLISLAEKSKDMALIPNHFLLQVAIIFVLCHNVCTKTNIYLDPGCQCQTLTKEMMTLCPQRKTTFLTSLALKQWKIFMPCIGRNWFAS